MKRQSTLCLLLLSFQLLLQTTIQAGQPDYSFKSPVLQSGTALQPGAVYLFSNVKNNVNARVTVMSATGGVKLTAIDETWTGFDEAFQPFIDISPNANGYVEFKIEFLNAANGNLQQQGQIPVTCIDVDGVTYRDGVLYEQDQVEFMPGYYDFKMTGGNLQVVNPPNWVTIKNTSGVSYSGIDTTAKDVMATVVNRNTSTFLLRIGALNTSPTESEVRYRSVYFKKFNYGHAEPLALGSLLSFSGSDKQKGVELKGIIANNNKFDKIIIEKGSSSSSFEKIGQLPLTISSSEVSFTFFDNNVSQAINYYRIRLVSSIDQSQEISNTLMIRNSNELYNNDLKIYNSIVQGSNPFLTMLSKNNVEAALQIVDMSGRMVYANKTRLNAGTNIINLSNFTTGKGNFLVVIKTQERSISQKIIVQ
jgi:hypothetical protein